MFFQDRHNWTLTVGRVFNTRPRIGSRKDTVWLDRKHTSQRFADAFNRPGAHVCLDGPTGAGKTSLALTHLFDAGISHASVQLTENMDWVEFCRQIVDEATNEETSLGGNIEVGIDNALPVAKFRISLGVKGRESDKLQLADLTARTMTEHDVARRLCELNAALFIDDVERANDPLLGRLSDLCKLLTQGYVTANAKLILVGSGEIYQKLYNKNPSLDERLLQISLGAFKSKYDSWKFLAKGFEKLRLRHPGTSEFMTQRNMLRPCIDSVWEAADGLPKSINRLGQEIALKAIGRKAVSYSDIIGEATKMTEQHWIEYGSKFPNVVHLLEEEPAAVAVLRCFYEQGIARIHLYQHIISYCEAFSATLPKRLDLADIDRAIRELVKQDFIVRTGKSEEIIFTKHPAAAHTLGVVMRDGNRFKRRIELQPREDLVKSAFPVQLELDLSTMEGAPSEDA